LRRKENESPNPAARARLADGALVVCAFFWGLGFVAMKDSLSVYPTFWLLFFRFGGGTVLTGLCFFGRIAGSSRRDWLGGAVIGVFLFLGMGIQTLGLNYTTAGKQAFLTASYVLMVPLLLWRLRGKFPGWISLTGAFVCFAGMGLLTSDAAGPLNVGDVLTVAAAVFFAGQIIAIWRCSTGGDFGTSGDPLVLTFVQFLVTALLSLGAAAVFEGAPAFQGTTGLGGILFMIFFCTFLCFLIQNVAQKYTAATHASILLGLESVFGLLGGVVLLDEKFTLRMGLGCSLIFGAILFVELAPALSRKRASLTAK
jgi:drug/metabolite transporter (DMT)-like permease